MTIESGTMSKEKKKQKKQLVDNKKPKEEKMIKNKEELINNLEGVKNGRKEAIIDLYEKYLGDFYFIETFGKNFHVRDDGKGWLFNNTDVSSVLNKTSIFASKVIEDKKMFNSFFSFLMLQKENSDICFNAESMLPIVVDKILANREMLKEKTISYQGEDLAKEQQKQTLEIFSNIKKQTEEEYIRKLTKINSIIQPIEFKDYYEEVFRSFLKNTSLEEKFYFNGLQFNGAKERFIVTFLEKSTNKSIDISLIPEDIVLETKGDEIHFSKELEVFKKIFFSLSKPNEEYIADNQDLGTRNISDEKDKTDMFNDAESFNEKTTHTTKKRRNK